MTSATTSLSNTALTSAASATEKMAASKDPSQTTAQEVFQKAAGSQQKTTASPPLQQHVVTLEPNDKNAAATAQARQAIQKKENADSLPQAAKESIDKELGWAKASLGKLASLFSETSAGTKAQINIEHLYFLPLELVIDLSLVTLLNKIYQHTPPEKRNHTLFQPVVLLISNKNWKNAASGTIVKQFQSLAAKLGHDNAYQETIKQYAASIQLLIGCRKIYKTPINSTEADSKVIREINDMTTELCNTFSVIILPIFREFFKEQARSFEGLHQRQMDLKAESKKLFMQGERVWGEDGACGSKVQENFVRLFLKLRSYTVSRFAELSRSSHKPVSGNSHDRLHHVVELYQKSARGFEIHASEIRNAFIGYEKWQALNACKGYSKVSDKFLRDNFHALQNVVVCFFKDLISKVPSLPQQNNLHWPIQDNQEKNPARFSLLFSLLCICLEIQLDKLFLTLHHADRNEEMEKAASKGLQKKVLERQQIIKDWQNGLPSSCETWMKAFCDICDQCSEKFIRSCIAVVEKSSQVCPVIHSTLGISRFYNDVAFIFGNMIVPLLEDIPGLAAMNYPAQMQVTDSLLIQRLTDFLKLQSSNLESQKYLESQIEMYSKRVLDQRNKAYGVENINRIFDVSIKRIKKHREIVQDLDDLCSVIGVLSNTFIPILNFGQKAKEQAAEKTDSEEDWSKWIDESSFDDELEFDVKEAAEPKPAAAKKKPHKNKLRKQAKQKEASSASLPMQLTVIKKPKAALPYPQQTDRLLALFRDRLALFYDMPEHVATPLSLTTVQPSLRSSAIQQQFHLLDGLQSVLEMLQATKSLDSKKLLASGFRFYENLVIEQGLTAAYAQRSPNSEPTHCIDELLASFTLDASKYTAGAYSRGTVPDRYPFAVPRVYHPVALGNETDLKNACESLDSRIKELIDIYAKVLGSNVPNDKKELLSLQVMGKESVAKSEASKLQSSLEGFSKVHTEQLRVQREALLKTLGTLNQYIQGMQKAANDDMYAINSLKNVRYHLQNLTQLVLLFQEFPQPRFQSALFHLFFFSVQYLAENLGAFLSLKNGAEVRTHNLSTYCHAYGLNEGLPEKLNKIFPDIDVRKASEYLFEFMRKRSGKHLSNFLLFQSGLYATSKIARLSLETGQSSAADKMSSETSNELVAHLGRLMELANSLLIQHIK